MLPKKFVLWGDASYLDKSLLFANALALIASLVSSESCRVCICSWCMQ